MKTITFAILTTAFFLSSTVAFAGVNNVTIRSFLATTDGKQTKVVWILDKLDYNVTCYLERSSDGLNFSAIKSFNIEFGFEGSMNYTDNTITGGTYFYRLHITKPGYIPFLSNIASIKIDNNKAEKNYSVANPFTNQLTISGKFDSNKKFQIELTDMNGRVRLVKQVNSATQAQTIVLSASDISMGMYILRVKEISTNNTTPVISKCVYKNIN